MENKEERPEVRTGVTDSGLEYTLATVKDVSDLDKDEDIMYEDYVKLKDIDIRIFKSSTNRRLKEEDETFQEYELRRSITNKAFKNKAKGNIIWNSKMWGTMTAEKQEKLKKIIEDGKRSEEKVNG